MRKATNGFTLIEVLIALFIFTIVAAIIASVLHSLLTTRDSLKKFNRQLATLQLAQVTMANDLTQVVLTPVFLPAARGGEPFISVQGTADHLQFIRGGYVNPLAEENRSTLLAISYSQRGKQLVRTMKKNLLTAQQQQGTQVLLADLQTVRFTYYDQQRRAYTLWPPSSAQLGTVPLAIRVTLQLNSWGEISQYYVMGQRGVS